MLGLGFRVSGPPFATRFHPEIEQLADATVRSFQQPGLPFVAVPGLQIRNAEPQHRSGSIP